MRKLNLHGCRLLLLAAVVAACLQVAARAPHLANAATGITPVSYAKGWNLVSFGGATALPFPADTIAGPLFALPPAASGYQPVDGQQLAPGTGYWAYFPKAVVVALSASAGSVDSLTLPVHGCASVGNPYADVSARVSGGDEVYVSPMGAAAEAEERLIPIGRGRSPATTAWRRRR